MSSDTTATMPLEAQKDWTSYSTGIAWGTVALFAVVVTSYLSMIAGLASGLVSLPVGMVIATIIIYLGFTVAHEAGHGNISHEAEWFKPYERLMGWSMNLLFIVLPFGLFAKIHDYHHAFTNDPERDPDHWVSGDTWLQASGRAVLLPFNYLYLTLTRFKNDPVITKTHKGSIVYYAVTLPLVITLIMNGFGLELLLIGIIPVLLASLVLGMLFDWIPHKPNRQQGRYQNTRSYLFPGLKFITMGQNYHHIHHLYPRVSWYHYQRVFNLIRPVLEENNAPIEHLLSRSLPGFGHSPHAKEPSDVANSHKLTLSVEQIVPLTEQAVEITFAPMNGKTIAFKAGQYITITKLINELPVTRCYSICSSPSSGKLSIGVKQVNGGLLSNYLNLNLKESDELTVAGPFGEFILPPANDSDNQPIVLIGGGSGITPLISIAREALHSAQGRELKLIYANNCVEDAMFLNELKQLRNDYPDRFTLIPVYKNPPKDWQGLVGYLDHANLKHILSSIENLDTSLFYICGPERLKTNALEAAEAMELPPEQVFVEDFTLSPPKPEGDAYPVKIVLANGQQHQLSVAENQTILQAATLEGIVIPHACGVGQCGCCKMEILEGRSDLIHEETPGLLPGEKDNGFTLSCRCHPKSALVLKEAAN
jgi:ferredoxin-NADP reductase/fatty acid desaturase